MKPLKLCASVTSLCALFVCVAPFMAAADSALITHLVFTNTPQTIQLDTASAVMTTQTKNATNVLEQVSAGTVLQYTSSSATGQFSNANSTSCSGSFSGAPFTLTMSTGSANKNFCYRDSTSGTHTLTVTAEGQGWTAATQDIVISAPPDTTPPVIAAHDDITEVEATSDAGVVVAYTPPDATDNVDAIAPAVCTPASGTTFALGTTAVTCTKTDAAGNNATSTTFSVTVVDTVPAGFTFFDQSGVAFNSEIVSDTIVVSGISTSTSISVTGGEYAVNDGAYTSASGTVASGDSVSVRHTSSGNNNTDVSTTLTIGTVSDTFTTTTSTGGGSGGGGGHSGGVGKSTETPLSAETETVPTVEPTIAATVNTPTSGEAAAQILALRAQALDLMYQWALAIRAQIKANSTV